MTPTVSALDAARAIQREVARTQLRARKGIKLIARRPPPQIGLTPKDEVWALGKARLWRYRNVDIRSRPPVLLFLGLVGDSAVFDIHPGNSWAERLIGEGFDVFLFDWGRPEQAESDHTLDTYLNGYFVHAVDAACRIAQSDSVSLVAYCMGALMAVLLLGSRSDVPAQNLALIAPPCDYAHSPVFLKGYRERLMKPSDAIDKTTGLVPEEAMRAMFRLLRPTSALVQSVTLWEHMWRDDYIEPHRAINHWAWSHRAMAGPAFTEMVTEFVQDNAMMAGSARLGGRPCEPSTIRTPTLIIIAERDEFVPPANSEPLAQLVGSADTELLRVPGGHAGALMGSVARKLTMPGVIDWLVRHSAPAAG